MENLTGAEKVLYRATYEFTIDVLKGSHTEAESAAKKKIEQKRKLVKTLKREH